MVVELSDIWPHQKVVVTTKVLIQGNDSKPPSTIIRAQDTGRVEGFSDMAES